MIFRGPSGADFEIPDEWLAERHREADRRNPCATAVVHGGSPNLGRTFQVDASENYRAKTDAERERPVTKHIRYN